MTKEPVYSRQFIAEIEKHIEPTLITYFNQNKDKFPVYQIKDAIYETLMSSFKGCLSKDELVPIINTIKNSRFRKRSRWTKDYINKLVTTDRTDSNYPLHITDLDEYEQNTLVKKEIANTLLWKERSDSFFIEFPGLHQVGDASVWSSFKTDLILCIWNYIVKELDGNISSFYRSYPESLLESPLFSPSSFNLIMKETGNNLLEEKVFDENGNPLLTLNMPNNKFTPPKVMDLTDLKILNAFISCIKNDFYRHKTVVLDIGTLTRSVVDFHPNSSTYATIAERCSKLVEYNYTILSENGKLTFNLFDNIIVRYNETKDIDPSEKDFSVVATFGEVLANAIIQKQLVKVTDKNYDALHHPMSKIIYYALEKERVSLHGSGKNSCIYSYTYFQKIVRFKVKTRSKNLKLIAESLNDFVDNGICVESFQKMNDGSFFIQFLPLTEEELEDINFNNPLLEKKK